jgi:hypothetical protein
MGIPKKRGVRERNTGALGTRIASDQGARLAHDVNPA